MISFLITVVIVCLVVCLILWIASLFIPQPYLNVVRAVVGVIVLIWLLLQLPALLHGIGPAYRW